MKIYVVQGSHPYVPGCPMSAFFSERSANDKAAELVRLIQKDMGLVPYATTATWEQHLDTLQQANHDCDVWITVVEVKD